MSQSKKVQFNCIDARKQLEESNWELLEYTLNSAFKLNIDETTGALIPFEYSNDILNFFCQVLREIAKIADRDEQLDDRVQKVMISTFRALRNYTLAPEVQNALVDNETIMQNTRYILAKLLSREMRYATYVKTILQFLCNLTIYATNKVKLLHLLGPVLVDVLKHPDFDYVSSALLYNIIKDADVDLKFIHLDIYSIILEMYAKGGDKNEYLGFIVELFLNNKNFYSNYRIYDTEKRLAILLALKDCVSKEAFKVDGELVDILVHEFKIKSDCILKTVADYLDDIEPLEVAYLLEILASLSGNEICLPYLQNDKSLLINCAFLLRGTHSVGKSSLNNFTLIQNLNDITRPGKAIRQHPAFGFKAALVRILGNLCWKHRGNQDELRELEVMPVILDCCNIDARNPLITQWAILAIRNMCESNGENQKYIASLTRQGIVDCSALKEMGLTLHSDNENRITTVVPMESLKSVKKNN